MKFKNLSDKPIAEVQSEQVKVWKKEDILHKIQNTLLQSEKTCANI